MVELDELLVDQQDQQPARSGLQWALVVVGGVVGVAGLLAVLVATAPALIEVVSWIGSIQKAAAG
jgi:hypothetical protein